MSQTPTSETDASTPSQAPLSAKELLAVLDDLGITQTTHHHRPVFTVEDGNDIKAKLPGGHTKNLFLKDKAGELYLISALGETQIPVNQLHKHWGCKRLSFGKPDLLLAHLGVTPGSVSVFCVINDPDQSVKLVLDKALFDHDLVNFHPLDNAATTAISPDDMVKFCRHFGHDPEIVDFSEMNQPDSS